MTDPAKGLIQALESWAGQHDTDRQQLSRLFAGAEEHAGLSSAEISDGRYIVPGLTPADWPAISQFNWVARINSAWQTIRAEFHTQHGKMNHYAEDEALAPVEQWQVYHLILFGRQVGKNVRACPATIQALAAVPEQAFAGTACFSVLAPETHVKAHTGFTNVRWRLHLPLVVPPCCGLRVGAESREWREGECLIFDDSAQHEAWNRSSSYRAVLLFDIWHPELTPLETRALTHLLGYWASWRVQLARDT